MNSVALASLTLMSLLSAADETPEPEDVKAGWLAFGIFGLLFLAVVLLGVSLTRHLRTADRAEAEGRFDPSNREARPAPRPAGPGPARVLSRRPGRRRPQPRVTRTRQSQAVRPGSARCSVCSAGPLLATLRETRPACTTAGS